MGDFLTDNPVVDWDESVPGQLKARLFGGKSTVLSAGDALMLAYVDVASAATVDIGAATSNKLRITGTTTITSLGTAAAGVIRHLRFAGILTLTHNATSLFIPGGVNITTAANDCAVVESLGSGNWFVSSYTRASGLAIASSGGAGLVLQMLVDRNTANTDLTAVIPNDDTTPLSSEGTQVLTLSPTLASGSSRVAIDAQIWGATSNAVGISAALFRGTTCINAAAGPNLGSVGDYRGIGFSDIDSPAASGAVTYSLRCGPMSNTLRLNGQSSGSPARRFGGAAACTLRIAELGS